MDKRFSQLEVARILGEPRDPRRPYPKLVNAVANTDTADPDEYVYNFDVLADTDKIYVITSSGDLTQENVSPDTPALLSFVDVSTPEYYIKLTDLAKAKERTLSRKTRTINRALNAEENYQIIQLLKECIDSGAGSEETLESGSDHFTYKNIINMLDGVKDYGDDFVLVAGTTIDKDIILWDWEDNKYTSLASAFKDLNIDVIRINQNISRDSGETTAILASTKAYLVARDTEMGRTVLFVRKKLDDIELLGGVISQAGDSPERLIFTSPNPVTVTSGEHRYLAIGVTGYEEFAGAAINPYGVARFNRA